MIPKYLYKYRNWDDPKHKRMLTHNEIFFASSKNFNDPSDTSVPLRFDQGTDQQMQQLLKDHISSNYGMQIDPKFETRLTELVQELAKYNSKFIDGFEADLQEKKFNQYGFFTMSSLCNNTLLWSNYADNHRGFCAKFDTDILNSCFQKYANAKQLIDIREVEYESEFPVLNVFEMSYEEIVVRQVSVKAADWSYEKEFRAILYKSTNLLYKLVPEVLIEVIIGVRMSKQSRSEIISVLKNRIPRVNLLQAKLKKGAFGLDFERIDY